MRPGLLFETSSLPTRAAIGPQQPSRACWRACWSTLKEERLTPSHAVKKGRRYRYYVSDALITDAGTDRAQGWRLAASEIEEAVIRILANALTQPGEFGPAVRCGRHAADSMDRAALSKR